MSELACVLENHMPGNALDVIVKLDPVLHLYKEISEELFALDERLLADLGPRQFQQIEGTE